MVQQVATTTSSSSSSSTTTIRSSVDPTTGATTTTTITQSDNGTTTTFTVTNSTTTTTTSGQVTTTSTSATYTADSTTLATGGQGSLTPTQVQNSTVVTTPNPDGSSTLSSTSTTVDTTTSTVTETQIDVSTTSDGQVHRNSTSTTANLDGSTSSTTMPDIHNTTDTSTLSTISSTISSIASSIASTAATAITSSFSSTSTSLGIASTSSPFPGNSTNSTTIEPTVDKGSSATNTALIAGLVVGASFVAAAGIYLARRYSKKGKVANLRDAERTASILALELDDFSGLSLGKEELERVGIIKTGDSQKVIDLKTAIAIGVKSIFGTQDMENSVLAHNYRVALAILRKKLNLEGKPINEFGEVDSQHINTLIAQITSSATTFESALTEYNLHSAKKLSIRDGNYLASVAQYLEPVLQYEQTDVDSDLERGQAIYSSAEERPRAIVLRDADLEYEFSQELDDFAKGIGAGYDKDSAPDAPRRQGVGIGEMYKNPVYAVVDRSKNRPVQNVGVYSDSALGFYAIPTADPDSIYGKASGVDLYEPHSSRGLPTGSMYEVPRGQEEVSGSHADIDFSEDPYSNTQGSGVFEGRTAVEEEMDHPPSSATLSPTLSTGREIGGRGSAKQ